MGPKFRRRVSLSASLVVSRIAVLSARPLISSGKSSFAGKPAPSTKTGTMVFPRRIARPISNRTQSFGLFRRVQVPGSIKTTKV